MRWLAILASFPVLTLAVTAEDERQVRSANAVIVVSTANPYPEANFDLRDASPSQAVSIRLTLKNTTGTKIRFDKVEAGCRCTKISPTSGTIEPRETMTLKMDLATIDLPQVNWGSGSLRFMYRGQVSLAAHFRYGFPTYVGFPAKLVLVTFPPNEKRQQDIQVPIVVGQSVQDGDFAVSIENVDCEFKYGIARDRKTIAGSLELRSDLVEKTYGEIVLTSSDGRRLQAIPLVLEPKAEIEIRPLSLRFFRTSDDDAFSATLYVRDNRRGNESDTRRDPLVAQGTIGKQILSCSNRSTGNGLYKVRISVSQEQAKLIRTEKDPENRAELKLIIGSVKQDFTVPFSFQERAR